jgi:hypothetical protein
MNTKTKVTGAFLVLALTLLGAGQARADVVAAWVEGHGGIESASAAPTSASTASGPMGGLGFQLGGRVLIFEAYVDHTAFGEGAAATRGVVGLRGGFGSQSLRLVLRGGLGVLDEEGGALTGRGEGTPERLGAVARAGVALERRIAAATLVGFGLDGEHFFLPATGPGGLEEGSDVFASMHLMFEIGI